MGSPSGRVPERAPERFLVATEACGGGTPDLGFFSGVSVFIGIFGIGLTSGGLRVTHVIGGAPRGVGRALHPRGWLGTLLAQLFYFEGLFWSIKIIKNWHVNWTPFGIPFLYNSKTRKNRNWHWALG